MSDVDAIIERLREDWAFDGPTGSRYVLLSAAVAAVREAAAPSPPDTDERVEQMARLIAGPVPCWCPDDWREPFDKAACPLHGGQEWPAGFHRERVRRFLGLNPDVLPDWQFAAREEDRIAGAVREERARIVALLRSDDGERVRDDALNAGIPPEDALAHFIEQGVGASSVPSRATPAGTGEEPDGSIGPAPPVPEGQDEASKSNPDEQEVDGA